jgi:hypothetical protein
LHDRRLKQGFVATGGAFAGHKDRDGMQFAVYEIKGTHLWVQFDLRRIADSFMPQEKWNRMIGPGS